MTTIGASAGVSKLVYDASVSCCHTRGKLVLYWLSVGSFASIRLVAVVMRAEQKY